MFFFIWLFLCVSVFVFICLVDVLCDITDHRLGKEIINDQKCHAESG